MQKTTTCDFTIVFYLSRAALKYMLKIFFRLESYFHPELDVEKSNYLIIANHCSNLDPPAVGCFYPKPIHFMAKQEMHDIPILGKFYFSKLGTIPVKRGSGDLNAIKLAIQYLKKGENVGIFPEGTRSPDGKMHKAKAGAGMIAYQSKAIILPVYVHNTFNVWSRHQKFPKFEKIKVFYGKPYLSELYKEKKSKELYQAIADEMMENIKKTKEYFKKYI